MPVGVDRQLEAVFHAELLVDRRQVIADRLFAQRQARADRLVSEAFADEGNDLDLLRAKDICTDQLVTVEASTDVDEAVRLMTDKAIRRIPVVENDIPIGIVTIGDLAAQLDAESALGQISSAAPNN